MQHRFIGTFIVFGLIIFAVMSPAYLAHSDTSTIEDLKAKINDRNQKIADLEKEIAAYQAQITATGKQSATLQNKIKSLELERKSLLTEIKVTENKIAAVTDNITQIGQEITDKTEKIENNKDAIAESIKEMNEKDAISFVENVLTYESVSDVMSELDSLTEVRESIKDELGKLQGLKTELEGKKTENEQKKTELLSLKDEYNDKKQITEVQKADTNKLLTQTKNQETTYQKLLADKQKQKEAFEAELFSFESELRLEIDPSRIPSPGKGVLHWPLDKITITQQFGDTDFSRANPGVYNGKGHNGIDLAAARGTPVKAALSGTVQGTGNTDLQAGCYSYGKWVLIKHANGLSTLYAHLDLIKVGAGDTVATGDVIGYSGNTGYTTGPHLHFTVYASQGVEIVKFGNVRSTTNCGSVSLPVADFRAYINPLLYLGN